MCVYISLNTCLLCTDKLIYCNVAAILPGVVGNGYKPVLILLTIKYYNYGKIRLFGSN